MAASFRPSTVVAAPTDGIFRCGTLTYTRRQLGVLFFWLLWGDFCFVLMESVVPNILPLKLDSLGANSKTIGLLLSTIPQILTAIFNPIVSFRSDRFRSRLGRRIPFVLFTAPFIVLCLCGIGFGEGIASWAHGSFGFLARHFSPGAVSVGIFGILLVLFTLCNTIGTSTYWYLFNDVVPEHLLARFMSWFRMVSMGSAFIFNAFIFPHWETHFRVILLGAGALYLVGFGMMCLNIREGEYPPPRANLDNSQGFIAAIKTYATECHSHWHYWYLFLGTLIGSFSGGMATFMTFFYRSTGLDAQQIGWVLAAPQGANAILIVISGWLADRYHPMRVVIFGAILNVVLVLPAQCIWIFWHPSANVAFWVWIAIMVGLSAPAAALIGVFDPPLLMRLFPRSNFGQFCSANQLWRSLGGAFGGVAAGAFLDFLRRPQPLTSHYYLSFYAGRYIPWFAEYRQTDEHVYTYIPVWQLMFTIPTVFLTYKLYQSWKRYGGDEGYEPPLPRARLVLQANVPESPAIPGTVGILRSAESVIEASHKGEGAISNTSDPR